MLKFRAGPVLKWAGGKQGIAGHLVKFFPPAFDRYFEPFVGGGSVLFALQPRKAVISDANKWLLDTYEALRADPVQVMEVLDGLVNTREEYMRIRKVHPTALSLFQRAAHLIYLNKTCFRGLFRVNRWGRFNVPYGQYDRRYYDPDNLRAVAEVLKPVAIRRGDFEWCLYDVTPRDFVYMDPPYFKLGGYSDFNRYTKDQFRENDHFRLAACCRELDLRGVRWAVSNSDTDFVRKLFDGYRIVTIDNRREINLNSQDRDITELLITNYVSPPQPVQRTLFDLIDQHSTHGPLSGGS
jgi:DNA adenine methylase